MNALVLLVLGQALAPAGSLVVPDPLARRSVNVERLDAGTVAANEGLFDAVHANVVDAGQAWVGVLRNPDGGTVYAPAGVAVDAASPICFNGPAGCSSRIFHNPATPDAGLYLQAGLPNGPVVATNDAGFWARTMRYQPWTLAAAPPCGAENAGETVTVLWPSGLSDGGFDAQAQTCDGEHWIQSRFLVGLTSDAKTSSGLFWRLDTAYPGAVVSIPGSVDTPGNGAQPVEYLLRQGAKVLCRGGLPSCAAPPGTAFRLFCGAAPATFTVSPDGGPAYALIAEVDAGCAQTPGVALEADVRRYGYPDPGWSPP